MQSSQHQQHSSSSCFYPQEMWNLNKTGIFLPKTRGNCLPGWRGVLEETRPASSSPKVCLERSVAQLQKLLFITELSTCAS